MNREQLICVADVMELVEHHDPQYSASAGEHHERKIDMDDAGVMEYARNMREHGYDTSKGLIELAVEDITWIVEGNHRAAAAMEAGISQLPISVELYEGQQLPSWLRVIDIEQVPDIIRPTISRQAMLDRLAVAHPDDTVEGVERPTLERMDEASHYQLQLVSVAGIQVDWDVDEAGVLAVQEAMKTGRQLPPIVVSQSGELIDGAHRLAAARAAGYEQLLAWTGYMERPQLAAFARRSELPKQSDPSGARDHG